MISPSGVGGGGRGLGNGHSSVRRIWTHVGVRVFSREPTNIRIFLSFPMKMKERI